MNIYLSDPKTGDKSVTLTAFVVGFAVSCCKLLLSGITFAGITLSPFSGSEFGIAVAAVGGIYVLRRQTTEKQDQ